MFTHRVEAGGSIIKGALCSFGQETLIRRERSLLIVCLVCLLIRIKQTDFKGQFHGGPCHLSIDSWFIQLW